MDANFVFMLGSLWAMVGAMIVWMIWTTLEAAIGKGKKKVTFKMAMKRFLLAMAVMVLWPFAIVLVYLWTLKRPRAFFLRLIFGKKKTHDRTPVRRHAQEGPGSHRLRSHPAEVG